MINLIHEHVRGQDLKAVSSSKILAPPQPQTVDETKSDVSSICSKKNELVSHQSKNMISQTHPSGASTGRDNCDSDLHLDDESFGLPASVDS